MKATDPQATLFDMRPIQEQDRQNRVKELTSAIPRPTTIESSQHFFRQLEKTKDTTYSCDASIKFRKGYDILRIVVKARDADDNADKFETKVDLELADSREYERLYLKAAQKAYDWWLEHEQEKG